MKNENKEFIKLLTSTAVPVVFQNLLQNSLSFADTIMIGQLGEISIAAVGLANQLNFFIIAAVFGLSSGASVFTSQFWGSKDTEGIQKAMGTAFVTSFVLTFILACLATFIPHVFLRIYISDADVISEGCRYLKWVGISYMFLAASQVMSVTIRSTGDTKTPMIITAVSMLANIALNYVLIFICNLGVSGAAMATTVSRLLEMIFLYYVLQTKSPVHFDAKTGFRLSRSFAKRMFKVSMPVFIDDTMWAVGFMIYKIVYSRMGVDVLACTNISEAVQDLFYIATISIGAAASILIGNEIGRGNFEKAQKEAEICMTGAVLTGFACALLMGLSALGVPYLFKVSTDVRRLAALSILAMSASLPVKFLNHTTICGIIRSGGDTAFMLITELIAMYFIGVPAAFISGMILKQPIYIVYLIVASEEITKMIVFVSRVLKGRWIHKV